MKAPSIASGSVTELYIYYDVAQADNTTYVGDTTDAVVHNVWDANFKLVMHMAQDPNGDGANAIKDSTSNQNDGTPAGSMTSADLVDGKIGKGIDFDGNDRLTLLNEADFDFATESFTIEVIFQTNTVAAGNYQLCGKYSSSGALGWFLRIDGTGALTMWVHDGAYKNASSGIGALSIDTLYYGVGVYDATANTIVLILNTTSYGPTSSVGSPSQNNLAVRIACVSDAPDQFLQGIVDEVRISNIARSAAWRKATYYSNWDGLVSYGAEEETSGWSGKVSGVSNPGKVLGISSTNIAKISGV